MVKPGQNVNLIVNFKNTGDEWHRFIIGATFRHVATNKDYDIELNNQAQGVGSEDETSFSWLIPANAPKGNYSVIAAVWEGETDGVPFNRLDDDVIPNAFNVE